MRQLNHTTFFLITIILFAFTSYCLYNSSLLPGDPIRIEEVPKKGLSKWTLTSLSLTDEQCAVAFPELNKEVENAVAQGPFEFKRKRDDIPGSIQGRIKDGKLYIISATQDNVLHRIGAILHSLHRAIITSPTLLPNTVFSININDIPRANSWSFVRSDDEFSPKTPWLMPHFSSWSWPQEYIGPLDEALTKIEKREEYIHWENKWDKAGWRGTAWFNPEWSPGLRPRLLEITEKKEWADVETWGQGHVGLDNTVTIEEFCRYKYIIYAEGKTYSGRLPYHQACASIILTPPPTFLLHTTHLMRPLFSTILRSTSHRPSDPVTPPLSSYPLPATNKTWPLSYPPHLANIIFVKPDWSDLEDTILYLRRNPDIGKRIAEKQREMYVGGGYLSEASEACYWRSLIRGWSSMVRFNDSEWEEGIRWETFSLLGKTTY